MFTNLDDFFHDKAALLVDKTGKPTPRELQVAAVGLLLKMASIDDNFATDEFTSIILALNRQFGLSDAEAGYNIEVAELLMKDEHRIDAFIKAISSGFEESQKVTILAMFWKVMMADGLVSRLEASFAGRTAELLGMNEKHIEQAKKLVDDGTV